MERNRTRIKEHSRQNTQLSKNVKRALLRQYLLFMVLVLAGILTGSIYINSAGVTKSALEGTGFFMQDLVSSEAASKGFLSLAVCSFFPSAALICISYLLGLCAVGFPFEFVIPILYGTFTGASMASIYIRFGAKGLLICLLFILPQALITVLAIIVASREGFKFSKQISHVILRGVQKNLTIMFRTYCFKYAICFVLAAIASIIQALSIILFSKIFLS
ncbi:MAG: stage II sporulation protein M [[Clostridium] cellulosi]